MIIVDQISKQYVPNQLALDNVSLKIGNGVFGLLGPNGAGKTTLMRILATLIAPTTGYVSIKDYNVLTHPQEIRRLLGYVPQEYQLYPHLNAREFLDYMAILSGWAMLDTSGLMRFFIRSAWPSTLAVHLKGSLAE